MDHDTAHEGEVYFTAYWVATMIGLIVIGVFAFPLMIVAVVLPTPWSFVLAVLVLARRVR